MDLKEKALTWFFKGSEDQREPMLRDKVISEERIVSYYLRRFPWEANCS